MRFILGSLLLAVMLGCGLENGEARNEVGTSQQALVNLQTPEPWSTYKGDLVPRGATNAYLVVVKHPHDPLKFLAWGFQVNLTHANTPLFFVVGMRRTEMSSMVEEFVNGAVVGSAFNPDFTWSLANSVGINPGPTPPIGTDHTPYSRAAANQATALFAATNHF